MRLTTKQVQIICENAAKYFGANVHVWLFGSRVDDQAKGGDIDLYIESQIHHAEELMTAKLYFLRELHKKLGEQKIDVVLQGSNMKELAIHRIAKQKGIVLQ